jgi:hypothetical protein
MENYENLVSTIDIPEEPLFLNIKKDFFNTDLSNDFCKFSQHSESSVNLNKQCSNLTAYNCNFSDCCVLVNRKKCVAGNEKGPIFLTNSNGTNINMDYFYYQGKCIGKKCPK